MPRGDSEVEGEKGRGVVTMLADLLSALLLAFVAFSLGWAVRATVTRARLRRTVPTVIVRPASVAIVKLECDLSAKDLGDLQSAIRETLGVSKVLTLTGGIDVSIVDVEGVGTKGRTS